MATAGRGRPGKPRGRPISLKSVAWAMSVSYAALRDMAGRLGIGERKGSDYWLTADELLMLKDFLRRAEDDLKVHGELAYYLAGALAYRHAIAVMNRAVRTVVEMGLPLALIKSQLRFVNRINRKFSEFLSGNASLYEFLKVLSDSGIVVPEEILIASLSAKRDERKATKVASFFVSKK